MNIILGVSEERINEQQDSSGETMRNGTQRARALENTDGKLKDVEDRVKRSDETFWSDESFRRGDRDLGYNMEPEFCLESNNKPLENFK